MSTNSISMASSRQFEMQHIQKRTELRQISINPKQNSSLELSNAEVEQLEKTTVTLSAEQAVQVNLLNSLFGRKLSIDTLNILVPSAEQSPVDLEPVELSDAEGVELVLSQNYHYEFEATAFEASGNITLSNGAETNFSFHVSYAREFESYSEQLVAQQELQDPLVINFSDQAMSVSSKTIEFDLNMDGVLDNMPTLSDQAGFIAIDKNNNGIIDDGSELFGAQTGNGFFELSQYDDNGDGYINKNDEVFSQLLVWQPGADEELIQLSSTTVDTLVLQSVETQFSFTNEHNQRLGQMRQSGVYANQDGSVGGLHQIDLVI